MIISNFCLCLLCKQINHAIRESIHEKFWSGFSDKKLLNLVKMRYFILYIFFLSALGSCKTDKVKPLSIFSDVVPEKIERDVRDMPVKGSAVDTIVVADCDLKERLHVSSWVDSITYLSLDNREEALLGAINKVVCRKDAIYLLDRYKSKSIKKFSMEGKFLTNIGTFGEAPEEYAEPTDFVVTDSLVIVYDQFTSR